MNTAEQTSILQQALNHQFINQAVFDKANTAISNGENYEQFLDESDITQDMILEIKKDYYNYPGLRVKRTDVTDEVLSKIPSKSIQSYQIIPIKIDGNQLVIGFVDPSNQTAREAADFISNTQGLVFKPVVVTKLDFDLLINSIDELSNEVDSALSQFESDFILDSVEESTVSPLSTTSSEDPNAAPVTKIVATIIRHASESNASDIHIEPFQTETKVRFRIDGALRQNLSLPVSTHSAVVARIKILADLRIDERRKPQDGRFSARIDKHKIDFRVSTFPTANGEKVVMRLLDSERNVGDLDSLGLSDRNLELVKSAIAEPYGLILISGPTGSGKSTTLYTMLGQVDRRTKNVLSLEDPVEYQISGVSQSSVNADIGYTFASGLRTVLRQDPDIIMVGEIRDKETAQLAVQAALTGHLVLSTIHTNSATGVIPRLVDMGVDPYLIAPTLKLAIGQRLVQKICKGSGREIPIEGSIRKMIDNQFQDLPMEYRKDIEYPRFVYGIEPTTRCPKGTSGRQAVFEVMKMTNEIEEILLSEPNEAKIFEAARRDGMLTMREDGMMKSFKHEIPFEEVNKLGTGIFAD